MRKPGKLISPVKQTKGGATYNRDRREGGGGAGRAAAPPLFCAPAPTFCAKKLKLKKRLETSFFPSIFRYILCIFFNFKRQAFCGAPVLFAVILPGADLPLDQTTCLGHPFASFGSVFCTSTSGRFFFLSVLFLFFDFQYKKIIFKCQPSHFSPCSAVPVQGILINYNKEKNQLTCEVTHAVAMSKK